MGDDSDYVRPFVITDAERKSEHNNTPPESLIGVEKPMSYGGIPITHTLVPLSAARHYARRDKENSVHFIYAERTQPPYWIAVPDEKFAEVSYRLRESVGERTVMHVTLPSTPETAPAFLKKTAHEYWKRKLGATDVAAEFGVNPDTVNYYTRMVDPRHPLFLPAVRKKRGAVRYRRYDLERWRIKRFNPAMWRNSRIAIMETILENLKNGRWADHGLGDPNE